MKIGIVGAGFTGLSAAYEAIKAGHDVTVIEKDSQPGGLAIGYQEKDWKWSLEKHYHHWFTNDSSVLGLAKEIGYKVHVRRPKTSVFIDGKTYPLDSPVNLLKFSKLSLIDRVRMGATLAIFRYNPFWKPLEKFYAAPVLSALMGKKGYEMIWEPQFRNKYGENKDKVSLAWFWARIVKRTPSLAYPEGGFLHFAQTLVTNIGNKGGKVLFGQEIIEIEGGDTTEITVQNKNGKEKFVFDRLIVTTPSFHFTQAATLPEKYVKNLLSVKSIGATNLVLRLKKTFFQNNEYWVSVCESGAPVMAMVEHTNYMDKKNYNNEHILYLGKYLSMDDPNFSLDAEQTFKLYHPFLKKIKPDYKKDLIGYKLFKAPFAQPIIPLNYSKTIAPFETPLQNVFLANMQQVYPWDRGTNYAVELGQKVVKHILYS